MDDSFQTAAARSHNLKIHVIEQPAYLCNSIVYLPVMRKESILVTEVVNVKFSYFGGAEWLELAGRRWFRRVIFPYDRLRLF